MVLTWKMLSGKNTVPDGRKGGWVYQDETGVFHHTYGKKPMQPLKKAFERTEPKIQKQMVNIVKESIGGGVSFD